MPPKLVSSLATATSWLFIALAVAISSLLTTIYTVDYGDHIEIIISIIGFWVFSGLACWVLQQIAKFYKAIANQQNHNKYARPFMRPPLPDGLDLSNIYKPQEFDLTEFQPRRCRNRA